MVTGVFLIVFRSLARRFNACLAEIHRVGVDNPSELGCEVIDEIYAIHAEFMTVTLDDIDMEKEIYSKLTDKSTETWANLWNRVVGFVYAYEDIFGEDSNLLRETEELRKNYAE